MHLNVISKATELGRLEEASAALKVAVARLGETPQVQTVAYSLAIAQGDRTAAERLEAAAADGAPLAGEIAKFAAARGKLYAARTRTGRLAAELERQGLSERAALYLSEQATYDALTGCADCVEQTRARIERLSAPDTIPRRLLSYALSLAAGAKPTNIWIPADLPPVAPQAFHVSTAMIRAQIALNQSRATDAVSLMRPLESSLLVPGPGLRAVEIYARALLAAGDTHGAVAQLMRVVNQPANDPTSPIHAIALVRLAEAHAAAGRTAEASTAYEKFLARWKDADPDVPLLLQARTAYAELTSRRTGSAAKNDQ
jgi:tetratricopeptide (TPR) repeat protein